MTDAAVVLVAAVGWACSIRLPGPVTTASTALRSAHGLPPQGPEVAAGDGVAKKVIESFLPSD